MQHDLRWIWNATQHNKSIEKCKHCNVFIIHHYPSSLVYSYMDAGQSWPLQYATGNVDLWKANTASMGIYLWLIQPVCYLIQTRNTHWGRRFISKDSLGFRGQWPKRDHIWGKGSRVCVRDFPLAAVWISFQETELKPNPGTAQCLSCPAKFVFVWVCVCVCVGCCVCVGLCVCVFGSTRCGWVKIRISKW